MARLAKECGAAVGAVYRYLPGKSALLGGLQVRAVRVLSELMEERVAPIADPIERVQVAFGTWAVFSQLSPALFRLIDDSLSDPVPSLEPADREQVREVFSPLLQRCGQLIEQAVQAGALQPGDAQLRTLALLAAVHGAAHISRKVPLSPEAEPLDLEAQMVGALLRGWSPR